MICVCEFAVNSTPLGRELAALAKRSERHDVTFDNERGGIDGAIIRTCKSRVRVLVDERSRAWKIVNGKRVAIPGPAASEGIRDDDGTGSDWANAT